MRILPFLAAALVFTACAGAEAQAPARRTAMPPLQAAPELSMAAPAERVARETSRVGSRALAGAGIGFVVGAGVTYAVLHSGGSKSLCDRSANQDAMAARECIGLAALGGLAGAGVGAVVGARLRTGREGASVAYRGTALAPLPARGVGIALAVEF